MLANLLNKVLGKRKVTEVQSDARMKKHRKEEDTQSNQTLQPTHHCSLCALDFSTTAGYHQHVRSLWKTHIYCRSCYRLSPSVEALHSHTANCTEMDYEGQKIADLVARMRLVPANNPSSQKYWEKLGLRPLVTCPVCRCDEVSLFHRCGHGVCIACDDLLERNRTRNRLGVRQAKRCPTCSEPVRKPPIKVYL